MDRKSLLYFLAFIVFGISYLLAANVGGWYCESYWPLKWWETCTRALGSRLFWLGAGAAPAAILIYFAEKPTDEKRLNPPTFHEVWYDEARFLYSCRDCPFTTRSVPTASKHRLVRKTDLERRSAAAAQQFPSSIRSERPPAADLLDGEMWVYSREMQSLGRGQRIGTGSNGEPIIRVQPAILFDALYAWDGRTPNSQRASFVV